MAVILDIMGSFIIGAMVLLAVVTLHMDMSGGSDQMSQELIVQENMVELALEVDYDFHKIGYRTGNDIPITSADSTSITFLADIDNDGDVDSVRYFLGSPDDLASTPNPNDRLLFRLVNNEMPRASNMGVVGFGLTFYDASGNQTSVLADIRAIEVHLDVEGTYPLADTTYGAYPGVHWEEYIVPMNIQSE